MRRPVLRELADYLGRVGPLGFEPGFLDPQVADVVPPLLGGGASDLLDHLASCSSRPMA